MWIFSCFTHLRPGCLGNLRRTKPCELSRGALFGGGSKIALFMKATSGSSARLGSSASSINGRFRPSGGHDSGMSALERQKEDFRQYLSLPIEQRRKKYNSSYIALDDIPVWPEYLEQNEDKILKLKTQEAVYKTVDGAINNKVSIFTGDITTLEIDAIVNAANERMLGGGGVDGAIHRAAGPRLLKECEAVPGSPRCPTGEARITYGYDIPATHIIHTVGPQGVRPDELRACYENSLKLLVKKKLRSIAFPCISTGIYGYPNDNACKEALNAVRCFLEEHGAKVDRVIFCLFMDVDKHSYHAYFPMFFPLRKKAID